MNNKKKLGQFYTTNFEYILNGLVIPAEFNDIVEPFVGQGDLLNWIGANKTVECYDLDPKIDATTQNTLLEPPVYKNKFVITNPPYLAKNKNKDKSIYNKWQVDDLYKAFIKSFVEGEVNGGIIIVPLNFLCDEDSKIRDLFFQNYTITKLNIFEEKVFKDTTYIVCAFSFIKGKQKSAIETHIYPVASTIMLNLNENYGWRIGGEIYTNITTTHKITRLQANQKPNTTLFLYAIDTGSANGRIRLEHNHQPFYGKNTDRAFASIVSNIPIKDEKLLCEKFNNEIENLRLKYNSLFLTNYRNSSKLYARKRISFDLAYKIISEILDEIN